MTTIAFIGLGNMGGPMALNLLKAGYRLNVFDLQPDLLQTAHEAGATVAESALAATEGADIILSMLPAGEHVERLYLGDESSADGGLLDQLTGTPLLIDSSTIDQQSTLKVAEAAARRGLTILDAPVSGGVSGARAGTLSFMVGGPAEAFERARSLLAVMGNNIFHAGDQGKGQVAKLCNNMLLGILMSGTAEALALGVKNGLDPEVLSTIMQQSSGGNWALNVYNPWPGVMASAPASHDYQGGFLVRLMAKDLDLAMRNAQTMKAAVPMGALARNLYALHAQSEPGVEALDFSSIQRFYVRS